MSVDSAFLYKISRLMNVFMLESHVYEKDNAKLLNHVFCLR